MNRLLLAPIAGAFLAATAFAQSGSIEQCPFSADYLSAQLGQKFQAGVPEKGMLGKGCRYDGQAVKLWIDAGVNPAPTAEAWRKMSNPPGTTWKSMPNDPDKAVHTVAKADVSPFPSLSYERKGYLVSITMTGVSDKSSIDSWNAKLAKLNRFPAN